MKRKSFIFDQELFSGGCVENCQIYENALCCCQGNGMGDIKSVYISASLDSREKETCWGRVKMKMEIPDNSFVTFSYFASDEKNIQAEDMQLSMEDLLADMAMPMSRKQSVLEPLWLESKINTDDLFINNAKGRYFWFQIEFTATRGLPKIWDLEIEFPMESIVEYLPAFYGENKENFEFLSRFLGSYQSLIYDLQYEIDNASRHFDVDFAQGDFLQWLSKWTAADIPIYWEKDTFRFFVKNSFRFYKTKGTRECLISVLELYLGERPRIIETYQILDFYRSREYEKSLQRLYGFDKYSFFILLPEQCIQTMDHLADIKKLVEVFKPAHTKANIIVLKNSMILGQYTYLEINSSICDDAQLKLDNTSALSFQSIIRDGEEPES